jgi:cytoskeletal protein CcmA (bactofilin family)
MKNPFKRAGFDSLLSTDTTINNGSLTIAANQTLILDGNFIGNNVGQGGEPAVNKTTLVVGGLLKVNTVEVSNVTVTGRVECELLIVEGVLSVKGGAEIKARQIRYRTLNVEPTAVVLAQLAHLDHISAGEQT